MRGEDDITGDIRMDPGGVEGDDPAGGGPSDASDETPTAASSGPRASGRRPFSDGSDGSGRPGRGPGAEGYLPGDRVGRYTVRRSLGEGGMGVVYEAEQDEPVRRRVALKVIKPGMDSRAVVARFEAERQALALMDHPCVAKVIDGGVTDHGLPYFAMELVKGLPITEHCDRNKLSLGERLGLFIRVCEAVQHAHAKGVIHRDLKPSNILIEYEGDAAVPKVIDFGVAKALSQSLTEATIFTQHGQLVGTPEYMSPEQAEMGAQDIDTRADVYSLGVMLYELLTGARPFEPDTLRRAALGEIQRIIREVEPERPSTRLSSLRSAADGSTRVSEVAERRRSQISALTSALRRDLDWVVMKCLEKDRSRRYETPSALASDLRRYLEDEPVQAGPPGVSYRVGKFVKRNRAPVAAAALGLLLLVGGLAGTGYGLIEARRERSLAARRAEELQRVVDFQSARLEDIEPERMGVGLRRTLREASAEEQRAALERGLERVNFTDVARRTLERSLFDRTVAAIDEQFAEQPLVRARLLQSTADTMATLGLFDAAAGPQRRALEIRRERLGDEHPETLGSLAAAGVLLARRGRLDEAEPLAREALSGRRRVLGEGAPETLESMAALGELLHARGAYDEAGPLIRDALRGRRDVLGEAHPDTLASMAAMGLLLRTRAEPDEAEAQYREAMEIARRELGGDHPETIDAMNNMGLMLETRGDYGEAERLYRQALEASRRALGDDHPGTLISINNMGTVLYMQGKLAEAEPYYREALDASRRMLGADHSNTLVLINNTANLLQDQGKLEEAERFHRRSLEARRRTLGPRHPATLTAMNNLAYLLRDAGRLDEAEDLYRRTLEGRRAAFGDEHPSTLSAINTLAGTLMRQATPEEAEPLYREALRLTRRIEPDDEAAIASALARLGACLVERSAYAQAEPVLAECVELRARSLPEGHWLLWNTRSMLGEAIAGLGDPARYPEAERLLVEAASNLDPPASLGPIRSERLRAAIRRVAELYSAWHDADPETGHDQKADAWRARLAEAG